MTSPTLRRTRAAGARLRLRWARRNTRHMFARALRHAAALLDPPEQIIARAEAANRSPLSGRTAHPSTWQPERDPHSWADLIEWHDAHGVALLRPRQRGPLIERGDTRLDPPRTLRRRPPEGDPTP